MAKKDSGLSKNARVAMRGKQGQKFLNGKKVKPIAIRSMNGKNIIGVFDEASGSLLMSDQSCGKKDFISWDSISSSLTNSI
jgi:hypothetical protein